METIYTNLLGNVNINICLIADIHFSEKYNIKLFDKIISNIKTHKPNYICVLGDTLDRSDVEDYQYINILYDFFNELSKMSKVIISLGNHDVVIRKNKKHIYRYPSKFINNLKSINNIIVLDNEIFEDNDIRFIGYTQGFESLHIEDGFENDIINEVSKLTNNIDNRKYNILLSHNPLYLSKDEVYNNINNFDKINLVLSGHTHNGMLPNIIKTNNLLISPNKIWFTKNGRGHYKKNKTDFIVTGGVVKLSKAAKIFHIFNALFSPNIDYIKVELQHEREINS